MPTRISALTRLFTDTPGDGYAVVDSPTAGTGRITASDFVKNLASKHMALAENDEKTGSYTLVPGDSGRLLRFTSSAESTLTVPTGIVPAGHKVARVFVLCTGTGAVNFVAGPGMVFRTVRASSKLLYQNTLAEVFVTDSNEFWVDNLPWGMDANQTLLQIRRMTAAQWSSTNPVLKDGELSFETDTGKIKIGDGVTVWTSRPYFLPEGAAPQIPTVWRDLVDNDFADPGDGVQTYTLQATDVDTFLHVATVSKTTVRLDLPPNLVTAISLGSNKFSGKSFGCLKQKPNVALTVRAKTVGSVTPSLIRLGSATEVVSNFTLAGGVDGKVEGFVCHFAGTVYRIW